MVEGEVGRARKQRGAVLGRCAHARGELALSLRAALRAAAGLSAMLCHREEHLREVEDLPALGRDGVRFVERTATAGA